MLDSEHRVGRVRHDLLGVGVQLVPPQVQRGHLPPEVAVVRGRRGRYDEARDAFFSINRVFFTHRAVNAAMTDLQYTRG